MIWSGALRRERRSSDRHRVDETGAGRLVLLFLSALLFTTSALAQDTVIRCGAIFDGDAMGGGGEIVVRDGRIVSGSGGLGCGDESTFPGTPAFPG